MSGITPRNDVLQVPPPPPKVADDSSVLAEVVIRTMASDLHSFSESGGLRARGEIVSVSIRTVSPQSSRKNTAYIRTVVWVLMAAAGFGFLFLIGYYFIPALLGQGLQ